jgi:hypothetical protein
MEAVSLAAKLARRAFEGSSGGSGSTRRSTVLAPFAPSVTETDSERAAAGRCRRSTRWAMRSPAGSVGRVAISAFASSSGLAS